MKTEHIEIDLSSSEANPSFIHKAQESLTKQLESLQREVSPYKSHGQRRPKREIEDIKKTQGHLMHQIKHALSILSGEKEGSIKFIKDIQTGKVLGFRITSENNNS